MSQPLVHRPTTLQQAAQTALDIQDASNLSGVLMTASRIVQDVIWPAAREAGQGTKFVNRHPIVTLALLLWAILAWRNL